MKVNNYTTNIYNIQKQKILTQNVLFKSKTNFDKSNFQLLTNNSSDTKKLPSLKEFRENIAHLSAYDRETDKYTNHFSPKALRFLYGTYKKILDRAELLNWLINQKVITNKGTYPRFNANNIKDCLNFYDNYQNQKRFLTDILKIKTTSPSDNSRNITYKYSPNLALEIAKLRAKNPKLKNFIDNTIHNKKISDELSHKLILLKISNSELADKFIKIMFNDLGDSFNIDKIQKLYTLNKEVEEVKSIYKIILKKQYLIL